MNALIQIKNRNSPGVVSILNSNEWLKHLSKYGCKIHVKENIQYKMCTDKVNSHLIVSY